jgi:Helix-turn-helix domain
MQYLNEYKTFDNVDQLNNAIKAHLVEHKFELNETDRQTLTIIARHAVKYLGAAHLKASTIANLIGKSEKTARRIVNKLARLGIVKKIATTRKGMGGCGANILVIQRVHAQVSSRDQAEKPTDTSVEQPKKQTETNNLQSYKNKLHKETVENADSLRRSIPTSMYNAFAPYFNADELYNVVGVLYRAKASVDRSITVEDFAQDFIDAFKAAVFAYKRGRVRSLTGYLFATWRQVTIEIKRRMSPLNYDWLGVVARNK